MNINIKKYTIILVAFVLTLQIICSSVIFAVEKPESTIVSQKQVENVPVVKQEIKKTTTKKWKKRYYAKNRVRTAPKAKSSVLKPTTNNVIANENNDKQIETITEQKQLNLTDFPGKKYNTDDIQSEKQPGGFNFLSVLSSLFFVIVLVFIFSWLYNKLRNVDPASLLAGKFTEKSTNKFNILSTATLGQGKNIHLVEINGKHLVIGSTVNNINLLTEINPDTDITQNIPDSFSEFEEDEKEDAENSADTSTDIDTDAYSVGYDEIYKQYLKESKPKDNGDDL